MAFINSYKTPADPTQAEILASLLEPYDLNSIVPVPPILATERVALVPFVPAVHGEPFFAVLQRNPDLQKYFGTLSFGRTFEEFLSCLEKRRRATNRAIFAIIDKTKEPQDGMDPQGKIAGLIGWTNAAPKQLSLELGPAIILPEFQGTFVSRNTLGLLLKYVLDMPSDGGLGYLRVAWCTFLDNGRSIGVAGKMGFKKEGTRRWANDQGAETINNSESDERDLFRYDCIIFSVLWGDWVRGTREHVLEQMRI
ncbi:acyl-CoA N-acyltransferase [Crepidotus variabilis]|uniref:Acyl-CoA N-acyltransferase n=1 Tax=Crepidotus variabilis TaxID=179855 RepID=A0A9P6EIV6_9AGAR|nr:acyl-CoA N-acyltransferase [Crepidotus variabilis]